MSIFSRIIDDFVLARDRVHAEVKNKYGTIFKGGVALLGVFLIGMSQTYPILLDHEYEARKLQYKVEANAGKSLNSLDCKDTSDVVICKLAKYKSASVSSATKLTFDLILLCFYVGLVLIVVSAIGFFDSTGGERST